MTKTARKPRTDSISEMTRIMSGAAREISPPSHVSLGDMDWPFWESVVAEFARADWTEHQLELAAMLARTMADLEENQRLLRSEGLMILKEFKDKKGEVRKILSCENLRARAVQTLMGQVLALRRSLALHAKAKSGSNADAAKQREANKRTEQAGEGKDDLLA
jgi:hypothetical protein